jgi:hypothetical protein
MAYSGDLAKNVRKRVDKTKNWGDRPDGHSRFRGGGYCAVAGRLSEDPQTSLTLLDAGGNDDNRVITPPALTVTGTIDN